MKKLRLLLPMLAIVLGIALSAFTGTKVSSTAIQWEYLGPVGDEDNPDNYFPLTGQPQFECGTNETTVCTIYADSDNDPIDPHPILNGLNPMNEGSFSTVKRAAP